MFNEIENAIIGMLRQNLSEDEGTYSKQIDYNIEAKPRIGILLPAIAEIISEKI
jgi:hypothetical protein